MPESLEGDQKHGTSIFDPVLCELAYRWFCPTGGRVLDPFAGGSVRGIVASHLGRHYVGIDLRPEQVEANREQLEIAADPKPEWLEGDAKDLAQLVSGPFDLLFTCPPYGDLEVYSEDPRDLSNMDYDSFLASYFDIIKSAASFLEEDRFAVIVVGDFRGKHGFYRGFPGDTVRAFCEAGLKPYNEAVLLNAIGSLPVRVTKQFQVSRKLGKAHQNVLVFVKGDPQKATEAVGEVEVGAIE